MSSRRRTGLLSWGGAGTHDDSLLEAADHGDVAGIEAALRDGADVNCCDGKDRTPLYWASMNGYVGAIDALLAAGAHVNAANKSAWTPLHIASWNNEVDAVRALLAGGADVNVTNAGGSTPLHEAAVNGCVFVVQVLLDGGADPCIPSDYGKRPIDVVCTYEFLQGDVKVSAPAITLLLRCAMAWSRRKAAVCACAFSLW